MSAITFLRQLAEYKQFDQLAELALETWETEQDIDSLILATLALSRLGKLDKAEHYYQLIKAQPIELSADAEVDFAMVLLARSGLNEAKACLNNVLDKQPTHALALARLGYCCSLEEDYQRAKESYEQSLRLGVDNFLVYTNLINANLVLETYDDAKEAIQNAKQFLVHKESIYPDYVFEQYQQMLEELELNYWVKTEGFAFIEEEIETKVSLFNNQAISESTAANYILLYASLLAQHDLHEEALSILRQYRKTFKDYIGFYQKMAELAEVLGQKPLATRLLQRAVKLLEDKPDASLVEKITLNIKLAETIAHNLSDKGYDIAKKALALCEDASVDENFTEAMQTSLTLKAKCVLADTLKNKDDNTTAEATYLEVLHSNEYHNEALQGLGHLYMQLGRIDEAVTLFEKLKEFNPLKGFSSLVNARQFPEDIETLEKVEKAAKSPSMAGSVKSGVLFQLASAYEKRKDYDKAFEVIDEANKISRRHLSYDAKEHRNRCARIRARFTKALFEARQGFGSQSTLPVYVVGMPRSGTTLVEQIIASHSEIFGAGELGLIPQVIQQINRWERYVGSNRQYPDCVDDLSKEKTLELADKVIEQLKEYHGEAKHVVDKMPHNFESVGLIKFLFPKAKIISVRRDPRDIAISNYFQNYHAKFGGMGFAYDLTDIGEQLADHNLLMHHWQQLFADEILEIQYEDLIADIETVAKKMLDYIGVPFEKAVLHYNELERSVKTASLWQVRQPIYHSSKQKWKRYTQHLAPLIQGTNAKIKPDAIDDMISMPEPGWLLQGVAFFEKNQLDDAEMLFKKILHHNPEHAAATYMVGLVYVQKGHLDEGIALIEKAVDKAPWQKEWKANLDIALEAKASSSMS